MAKKSAKNQKSNELDAQEFFAAIALIEKERGIPKSYMMDKITQALVSAYKRDHEGVTDNVFIEADEEKCTVRMFIKKEVVEEVDNPSTEMALDEARKTLPSAQLGDMLRIEIKPRNFGRIAAQTARQVIIQGMREAEHSMIYETFSSKEHDMMVGTVVRVDPRNGGVSVRLFSEGEHTDAYLAPSEQVRGEEIREGDRLRVFIVEVRRSSRGPQVQVSRTHPGLVKRLFEMEVPEIYDGTVEIRSIAREAGSRSKLAVWSEDPNVDPIGACVGPKGARVNNVVAELRNEKIDIVKFSEDPGEYIAAALAPSDVIAVRTLEDGKNCRVTVPDDQLSLAIGKEGQNARLAARLTGYKIDIKSVSAAHEWEEEDAAAEAERLAREAEEAEAAAEDLDSAEAETDNGEPEEAFAGMEAEEPAGDPSAEGPEEPAGDAAAEEREEPAAAAADEAAEI